MHLTQRTEWHFDSVPDRLLTWLVRQHLKQPRRSEVSYKMYFYSKDMFDAALR